jgi:hypothetical protein
MRRGLSAYEAQADLRRLGDYGLASKQSLEEKIMDLMSVAQQWKGRCGF